VLVSPKRLFLFACVAIAARHSSKRQDKQEEFVPETGTLRRMSSWIGTAQLYDRGHRRTYLMAAMAARNRAMMSSRPGSVSWGASGRATTSRRISARSSPRHPGENMPYPNETSGIDVARKDHAGP